MWLMNLNDFDMSLQEDRKASLFWFEYLAVLSSGGRKQSILSLYVLLKSDLPQITHSQ